MYNWLYISFPTSLAHTNYTGLSFVDTNPFCPVAYIDRKSNSDYLTEELQNCERFLKIKSNSGSQNFIVCLSYLSFLFLNLQSPLKKDSDFLVKQASNSFILIKIANILALRKEYQLRNYNTILTQNFSL